MAEEIVVLSYARTPFGAFQGSLSSVPAPRLGATAIQAALKHANVRPDQVSEVIMGQVLMAGVGQAPARQAAIYAGIPHSVPCVTLNKVCGSGMKAVIMGMQSLLLGDSKIVVAGGMENMSLAPYLSLEARAGLRLGHRQLLDGMIHDGLWDPYHNQHMGNCGELCAREMTFSRQQQDEFAIESFRRAQRAQTEGKFTEICPVEVPGRKGKVTVVEQDEGPGKVDFDRIPSLRPAFDPEGSVTAANASSINDGAAALVLSTRSHAESLGLPILGRLQAYAHHAQDPEWFTTAPIEGIRKAADKAGWKLEEIDLFEVNEAFAVVALAAQRELNLPQDRVNLWGGAIAIGHPIGASGARITGTLLAALRDQGLKKGIASICIGGGEATAICLEAI